MDQATQALLQADLSLAERVITDKTIRAQAEEAALILLALQTPGQVILEPSSGACRAWPTPNAWSVRPRT
jgi:hypothetical protein